MFYKRLVPFYIPESITTDYFHEALSAAESISNKPDLISKWIVRNFSWTTTVEAIKYFAPEFFYLTSQRFTGSKVTKIRLKI